MDFSIRFAIPFPRVASLLHLTGFSSWIENLFVFSYCYEVPQTRCVAYIDELLHRSTDIHDLELDLFYEIFVL